MRYNNYGFSPTPSSSSSLSPSSTPPPPSYSPKIYPFDEVDDQDRQNGHRNPTTTLSFKTRERESEPLLTSSFHSYPHPPFRSERSFEYEDLSQILFSMDNAAELGMTTSGSAGVGSGNARLKLFRRVIHKLETKHEPGLSSKQLMLTNHDLKPVEPARRQWRSLNFVGFWIADSFNITTWMICSSMITAGLSWWQSWLCVWIGYFIAGSFICCTGRIGAVYHIGFPVACRSSFGIWGSLWPVFNRAGMACIWYGVQSWIGGSCIYLMIRSISSSFDNIKNIMPGSSEPDAPHYMATDTPHFISFLIFCLLSLPAIWVPVHKIRHLFTVKAYIVPVAGIGFFAWCIKKAGGIGPILKQPNTVHGSQLSWNLLAGIMSSIGNFATLIVNDPDFSRFAKKPKDALWSQLITIPCGFALTSFVGIIVSSSSSIMYGEPVWNPLQLLDNFLIYPKGGAASDRAGVFFIAAAFALAQLGTNIAANSVSAGTDMTALAPRFLNIRRGGYICAAVGLVMCPWNLVSSSNKFTLYLSSYSVFLSSIAGVMICDYYAIRRGYLDIKGLYSGRETGPYYFTSGVNIRAYIAYICGILINVVGFAGAIGSAKVPIVATYIYRINFFAGFIVSSTVYWLCHRVAPMKAVSEVWLEVGDQVEDSDLVGEEDDDREASAGAVNSAKRGEGDTESGMEGKMEKAGKEE